MYVTRSVQEPPGALAKSMFVLALPPIINDILVENRQLRQLATRYSIGIDGWRTRYDQISKLYIE